MHKLKELNIWKKSIDLAVDVYTATKGFQKEETYGLTSQIRRSAVSIPSNISEGAGRNSDNEFLHFLGIANGSAYELETQVIISNRLALMDDEQTEVLLTQLTEIQKMNYGLMQKLKT